VTEFISKRKWQILALAAGIGVICFTLLAGSGWAVSRFTRTPTPTIAPVSFGYCGESLTGLCVVSFGRDAFGNGIVNLYAPPEKFSEFYLNVVRKSGEERFDCVWVEEVETSVYCFGAPLILGEGMEIQIRSLTDDSLLAQGTFALTAFLVQTPPVQSALEEAAATPTPDGTPTPLEAPGGRPRPSPVSSARPSRTPTPSASSYPSYP
jgi:hypothetical protein